MSGAGGGGGGAGGGAHKSNVLVTAGVAAAALVFGFWKAKNARAPVRRQSTKDSAAGGGSKSAGEDRFENDDKSPESGLVPVVQKLPLAHVLQSSAHLDTAAQSGPDSYDHGAADADEDDVVDSTTSSSYQQYRWPRIHEDSPHRTFDERVATKCAVGQRVMVRRSKQQGSRGTVRFVGRMPSVRPGVWIGVELDADAGPGKNSGDARGRKVFECAPGQGMFCLEDAVEAADAPTDVYAAAARLAGRWVGECVSHGVLPTQSLEAAGLHGTHLCTPISDNNPGGSRDGQPGPVAGSFWFVFQGSGDDSGVDDGLSPHSVAGEWPTCRSFVDGRRCGTGEWSIALREHHFLQRLVVSCSPSTVEGTHSQPQSATASQADGTGSDEGTAGTHVPTRARSAFAVSFLDNNRIELRFGATPEAFEAGEVRFVAQDFILVHNMSVQCCTKLSDGSFAVGACMLGVRGMFRGWWFCGWSMCRWPFRVGVFRVVSVLCCASTS